MRPGSRCSPTDMRSASRRAPAGRAPCSTRSSSSSSCARCGCPVSAGSASSRSCTGTRPDVAGVVTTEVDDLAVAEEALDAGALDHVVKPSRPNDLLVTIACALRRRHELLRSSVAMERASSEIDRQGRLLEAAQLDAVERLARAVELRDDQLRGHHGRVAHATGQLARTIGMPDAQSDRIAAAGLLHDVGKIGIPTASSQTGAADRDRARDRPVPYDDRPCAARRLLPSGAEDGRRDRSIITSGSTAAATRTGCAGRRFRSSRGWWRSPTRSTP